MLLTTVFKLKLPILIPMEAVELLKPVKLIYLKLFLKIKEKELLKLITPVLFMLNYNNNL